MCFDKNIRRFQVKKGNVTSNERNSHGYEFSQVNTPLLKILLPVLRPVIDIFKSFVIRSDFSVLNSRWLLSTFVRASMLKVRSYWLLFIVIFSLLLQGFSDGDRWIRAVNTLATSLVHLR